MFMKHYAPNRCLYIKVAKLRTGLGSAEMSHLQNCSLKIYLKSTGGGDRVGGGVRMDVNEELVFVKIQKKKYIYFFFLGGGGRVGGGGGVGLGGQGRCEQRSEVFVKINKKNYFFFFVVFFFFGGGGGGVTGWM